MNAPLMKDRDPIPEKTSSKPLTPWSIELQGVLDQPTASFPSRLMLGGLLFCLAFGSWAWFSQVEEVGKAQGQLIPKGETYKLEPLALGKITHLQVKEGESVKAGEVLIELDGELLQQEIEGLQETLTTSKLELGQKQALLENIRLKITTQQAIAISEQQGQLAAIALAEEKAATSERLLKWLRLDQRATVAREDRLQPLPTLTEQQLTQLRSEEKQHQERLNRLKAMEAEGVVSQEYVFQAQQALAQTQQKITQNQVQALADIEEQLFQSQQSQRDVQGRITQIEGDLLVSRQEAQKLWAEFQQKEAQSQQMRLEIQQQIKRLEVEITQLTADIANTNNQLNIAKAKLKHNFLTSPVNGTVFSLNVKNTGQVVQPGETIAEIAPQQNPLVLSAVLPDKEAGFVHSDMSVNIKFDAYPYQDYGAIAGTVISISPDTQTDEKLGSVYRIEIALSRNYVLEEGQKIQLKPGQTAQADIIIRRRRIAEILLDPLRQLQSSGINL